MVALPFTANGMSYGYAADGSRICRGAMMGRCSDEPEAAPRDAPLHLRKVPLDSGGYDPGGAYWGFPGDLWCAFSRDGEWVFYTRAATRAEAREEVPGVTWARA